MTEFKRKTFKINNKNRPDKVNMVHGRFRENKKESNEYDFQDIGSAFINGADYINSNDILSQIINLEEKKAENKLKLQDNSKKNKNPNKYFCTLNNREPTIIENVNLYDINEDDEELLQKYDQKQLEYEVLRLERFDVDTDYDQNRIADKVSDARDVIRTKDLKLEMLKRDYERLHKNVQVQDSAFTKVQADHEKQRRDLQNKERQLEIQRCTSHQRQNQISTVENQNVSLVQDVQNMFNGQTNPRPSTIVNNSRGTLDENDIINFFENPNLSNPRTGSRIDGTNQQNMIRTGTTIRHQLRAIEEVFEVLVPGMERLRSIATDGINQTRSRSVNQ